MASVAAETSEILMPDLNDAPAAQAATIPPTSQAITADEVALYDRQIRLWGMEAQERMRNSKILLITMRALANEVAKNLVLAGIGSLTVLDAENVHEDDLASQFFISEEHVGQRRAEAAAPAIQRLNPRVGVKIDTESVRRKSADFFKSFDIVIATELDLDSMLFVNEATRQYGIPFYAAATYGLYGYIFADLVAYDYVVKVENPGSKAAVKQETRTRSVVASRQIVEGDKKMEAISKHEEYVTLPEALKHGIDRTMRLNKKKRIPGVLPGVKALWKFQQQKGRLPDTKKDDYAAFTEYMTEANNDLGLPDSLVDSSFIRSFVSNATCELSPVAATLGGILAQEAINVLAKSEQPIQNLLVFDGDNSAAPIILLAPQE